MPQLFCSGIEKAATAELIAAVPGALGMLSFAEYSPDLFAACEALGLPIAMDSGAFGRTIDEAWIDKYARVLSELGERCLWYAAPDVIGDQARSNANYEKLCVRLSPARRSQVLWVYQINAPWHYLEEGLARHSRIGVGGLVAYLEQHPEGEKLQRVARRIAEYHEERWPHFFGLGRRWWIRWLTQLTRGNFSLDQTTWNIGSKYRKVLRDDGSQILIKQAKLRLTPEEANKQNIRVLLEWQEYLEEIQIANLEAEPEPGQLAWLA